MILEEINKEETSSSFNFVHCLKLQIFAKMFRTNYSVNWDISVRVPLWFTNTALQAVMILVTMASGKIFGD